MTIKEHIAFGKKVLARVRNDDPGAIVPINEEIQQWERLDALVEAVKASMPAIIMEDRMPALADAIDDLARCGDI